MDWSNEPYVKVYTRETDDDLALTWEAVALWNQLMKRFDRSGFIETRRGARGIAAITRIPLQVVERVLPELLEDGRLVAVDGGFCAPNYINAQEATKSDKLRQKDSRDRRRATALDRGVTSRDGAVTNRDAGITSCDSSVTPGHAASRDVTLCSADPDPLQSSALELAPRAHAIPPSTQYSPGDAAHRMRLAESTYTRIATARDELIAELGLRNEVSMPRNTFGAEPAGFRDLRERIRGEGAVAPAACDRVVETLVQQAREERSVVWLSDKAFTEGAWREARNGGGRRPRASAQPARAVRGGSIGSATPRTDHGSAMRPAKEVM